MKNTFKIIGIFVLLLVLINPMYYAYVGYHVQLKKIKKEVKTKLIFNTPKEDLVTFQFKLSSKRFKSLDWKHSREFELDGKMFDIVEADTIDGFAHYLCFPDKQETALNQEFKDLLDERYAKDKPTNNKQKMLASFMKSLFVQDQEITTFLVVQDCKVYNSFVVEIIPSNYIKTLYPPPQFL